MVAAAAAAVAEEETPTSAAPSREPSPQALEEVRDLLSKLNPSAKEFVPSSRRLSADAPAYVAVPGAELGSFGKDSSSDGSLSGNQNRRSLQRRTVLGRGRQSFRGGRARRAEREDSVRRTVYVSDIDQEITEEKLAALFSSCGPIVDCRICGDPHSVLRFAFIEFAYEGGARQALSINGAFLGGYQIRVLPSKTAILPVNPKFLPRTIDEKELVVRTVYCTNIDKKVTESDVKIFFEHYCGEVSRLRLLGDYVHSTCIAFVEFVNAESAISALNCSGMIVGNLPIRVSPSKTPVRQRSSRAPSQ